MKRNLSRYVAKPGLKGLIISEFGSLDEFSFRIGFERQIISNVHLGKTRPHPHTVRTICEGLGRPIDELFDFIPANFIYATESLQTAYKGMGYSGQEFAELIGTKYNNLKMFQSGTQSISRALCDRILKVVGEDKFEEYFEYKQTSQKYKRKGRE